MNKLLKKAVSVLLSCSIILLHFTCFATSNVFASEDPNTVTEEIVESAYTLGILQGYIKPDEISLDQWKEENVDFEKSYREGLENNVYDKNTTYTEWLQWNCYGQGPKDEDFIDPNYFYFNNIQRSSVQGFNLQRGDILITNGTSSAGYVGHAAICNGDNVVLDMPGPDFKKGTRQISQQQWIDKYTSKGWVKVYRCPDSNVAKQAARWADRNYYSSNGTATQDIFPEYKITTNLYSKNPSYCSKLVFHAYYFGTGSTPVMQNLFRYSLVPPYDLIAAFNLNYQPKLVHKYNKK